MLSELRIRGFKSLLDTTFELGVINIFIGANGSGKSNILESLGVLSAASSGIVNDESISRRGVRAGLPTLYKSSFLYKNTPTEILFSAATTAGARYSVSLRNPIDKPSKSWEFKSESLKVSNENILLKNYATWRNKEIGLVATGLAQENEDSPAVNLVTHLQEYAIYTPNTPTLRGLLPDALRGAVGLQGGGLAEAVQTLMKLDNEEDFLNDALELMDWIDSPEVTTSASMLLAPSVARQKNILVFNDRFMKKNRSRLTAYDASEGALYVLFALALARSPDTLPIFAVDNFDQALNPRLAKRMAKLFCDWMLHPAKQERQALLTVHNPITLDELPILDDRIRLFTVDRDNHGITQIQRVVVTEKLRTIAQKNGWPLSRLWVEGHLGGVPNV